MQQLTVTSTAFSASGPIPKQYTCDGANISPPLAWSGAPSGTLSYALIADDPDAPSGTWVHWVLYDLPASVTELPEAVRLDNGAKQGATDFKRFGFRKRGYGGPCPPSGTHRYYFKLYALDTLLNLDSGATKQQLLQAMEGHILAQGELMGTYQRQ